MSLESIRNTSSPPRVMTGKPEDGNAAPNLDAERQLAAKACGGDRAAFGTLYERYVDRIYRYVYFKVGNRAQAEDLTSQTFLKAWDAIGDYEWRDHPFGAWLFRIAHNLVVDYHRSRREVLGLDDATRQLEAKASRDDARPERMLAELISMERVRHAIGRLTEEQQQVLVLRFFEGLDTGEVADLMGKRRGAIRGLQFRALSALRELLHREQDELILS
ncbi:MAG: sigma-70 family RNA polymerase sigma factor [Ardenticatenales bacterium]|nr:sigma-70 family RNA polymerase sigma factor [Ardenticatenales bacterium]